MEAGQAKKTGSGRAVFLDRDGVLNALVFNEEQGFLDSPARANQLQLLPGAAAAVARLNARGLTVVVVTNQPGIAKGFLDRAELERIHLKLRAELEAGGATVEAIYCCLHHPRGRPEGDRSLVGPCDCRKPAAGLLRRAAADLGLDLEKCIMVGDGFPDLEAAAAAGARAILIGSGKCEECRRLAERNLKPAAVAADLPAAVELIESWLAER